MLPVTIGAFNGARSSEQVLVWSARSMGANRMRMLWDVVVPSAMPELLNGVRTALALSFILLVSSELIVAQHGLSAVIDLEASLDRGIPVNPNQLIYVYFPFRDEDVPTLHKLHAVARLGASLITAGERVLIHCQMGLNRSALVAGLVLVYSGLSGEDAVARLQDRRPGALYNGAFAAYLRQQPRGGGLV